MAIAGGRWRDRWRLYGVAVRDKKVREAGDIAVCTAKRFSLILLLLDFSSLQYLPNSDLLVSGSDDQTLKVWNAISQTCVATFTGHEGPITSLLKIQGKEHIFSGGENPFIKVWDVDSGNCISTFDGHNDATTSLLQLANSNLIVSGSVDDTIKIWALSSSEPGGICIQTITGNTDGIFCLLHIPVKDLVISGGYKEIKVWKCEKPNEQQVKHLQEIFLQNATT